MELQVTSEIGILQSVLLGSARSFELHEPINSTQREFYPKDPPRKPILLEQQGRLVEVLKKYGVEIIWAEFRQDSPNQIFTRDIATVLGNILIITSMKEPIRKNETLALDRVIANLASPVLTVEEGVLEGGDVIIDGNTLFVGLSQRTNGDGLDWVAKTTSSSFSIIPIKLAHSFLHLDVVFNILPKNQALIYAPAIQRDTLKLLSQRFSLIEVTSDEQKTLATNVFSITPEDVIADIRHKRVNSLLRSRGINIIELEFNEVTKIGGAFRCAACPLIRSKTN